MFYSNAHEIIKRNNLIPRRVSKDVLNSISLGNDKCPAGASTYVSDEEYKQLKSRYKYAKERLNAQSREPGPRNLPFYIMIRDRLPSFDWSHHEPAMGLNRYAVRLELPLVEGLLPSLLSLLLRPLETRGGSGLYGLYSCIHRLPEKFVTALSDLLKKQNFTSLSEDSMSAIVDWLAKGLAGETLTLLTPICPDYEAQRIGPNLYRYTFANLGSQVGVVGKRYLQALPDIAVMFSALGIRPRMIVAIGDFEGFSAVDRDRLGVSEQEFMARLRASQERLAENTCVDVETPFITDLCGGPKQWTEIYQEVYERMARGDRGQTRLSGSDIKSIAAARAPLYRRWMNTAEFDPTQRLILQGAEYATMGLIAERYLENPLIIGADHWKMGPFFQFSNHIPMMYLKPNYADVA